MITWKFLAIGRQITLQRGVDITKEQQVESGSYPVVSSGGVSSFHDKFLCCGPGVLIGRKGSAGKLHYEERNYWPHDTTLYVKRFGKNLPKFVFYKLMTIKVETFDRSSANPTINRNLLHPLKVWWPSVDVQVELIRQLDLEAAHKGTLTDKIQSSANRLREFRSALITAAVTGQIDVNTWSRRGSIDLRLDQIEEAMGA